MYGHSLTHSLTQSVSNNGGERSSVAFPLFFAQVRLPALVREMTSKRR